MPFPAGSNYYAQCVTMNPTTGAASNADSLPVAKATRNGTDDAGFALTVTNLDTGRYKITGTVPAGYAAGDSVQVSVSATVATVAGKAIVDNFTVGSPTGTMTPVNVVQWAGGTVSLDALGYPNINVRDLGGAASAGAAGYAGIDWAQIRAPATPVTLGGTSLPKVWDEINTGSTHNINNSTGKQLRTAAPGGGSIYSGTAPAQIGMSPTQIKLDAGASATTGTYRGNVISITGGTGAGDSRIITAYDGPTRVATVDLAWTVQPDATSGFQIDAGARTFVAGYQPGQDPGSLILANPANLLATDGSGRVTLAGSGLDAVAVEAGLNARQSLAIIAAAVAGKGGTSSSLYKGAGVAATRIAFVAANGERSSITLTPPA